MEEKQKHKHEIEIEIEKCKKQVEEYLNNWKRERADFINYKKDEAKRLSEFAKFAGEGMILQVIDLIDDLEIFARHNSDLPHLQADKEGVGQILKKFSDWLKKYEVERILIDGKFDPNFHEAMETELEGEKMEEIRAGYTMSGKVIRPTRVKIIK